jgi:arsenate reductase
MNEARSRVLVLCTGNSCRSQMAEAFVRERLGTRWEVVSAGTAPAATVHPLAVRVMAEVGIDLAGARPKPVAQMLDQPWDLVVTVCDAAHETCPVFPGAVAKLHLSFDDPARATGDEMQRLAVFRRVRDEIAERLLPALAGFAAAVEGR